MPATRSGRKRELCRGIARFARQAEKHRVIRYGIEIERLPQLDIETAGMPDRLSLGVAIRVVRGCESAKRERIEGVGGVDMQIAKQRHSIGIHHAVTGDDLIRRLEDGVPGEPLHRISRLHFAGGVEVTFPRAAQACEKQNDCGDADPMNSMKMKQLKPPIKNHAHRTVPCVRIARREPH